MTGRPLIVQMSVEEDSNSLEGTPPEIFARRLDDWGAKHLALRHHSSRHPAGDVVAHGVALRREIVGRQHRAACERPRRHRKPHGARSGRLRQCDARRKNECGD